MKIICIGRNYVDHAKELNNEVPKEPVFFMKPPTALLREGYPFFIPEFTKQMEHEIEIVLRICKNGKFIQPAFADSYSDKIGLGIDFTARDIQNELKSKGLPWEKAKAFDNSAVVGELIPKNQIEDIKNINFHLEKNGDTVQEGHSSKMLFDFNSLISYVSRYCTLNTGDLLYTGTPAGVGTVQSGDNLTGYLQNSINFKLKIR